MRSYDFSTKKPVLALLIAAAFAQESAAVEVRATDFSQIGAFSRSADTGSYRYAPDIVLAQANTGGGGTVHEASVEQEAPAPVGFFSRLKAFFVRTLGSSPAEKPALAGETAEVINVPRTVVSVETPAPAPSAPPHRARVAAAVVTPPAPSTHVTVSAQAPAAPATSAPVAVVLKPSPVIASPPHATASIGVVEASAPKLPSLTVPPASTVVVKTKDATVTVAAPQPAPVIVSAYEPLASARVAIAAAPVSAPQVTHVTVAAVAPPTAAPVSAPQAAPLPNKGFSEQVSEAATTESGITVNGAPAVVVAAVSSPVVIPPQTLHGRSLRMDYPEESTPMPVVVVTASVFRTRLSDKTFQAALTRWVHEAPGKKWKLAWELPEAYEFTFENDFGGDLMQAIDEACVSLNAAGVPARAYSYEGNHVIRIVLEGTAR